MHRHVHTILLAVLVLALPRGASAGEPGGELLDDDGNFLEHGATLPTATPARVDGRGFAGFFSGYDTARRSRLFEATVEARLGPVAVRAGAAFVEGEPAKPSLGARLQVLDERRHGVDGAVAVFYKADGYAEGELEAQVSIGRTVGASRVLATAVYGQDPEGVERDGEFRLSGLRRFTAGVHGGVDAHYRIALGEAPREPEAVPAPEHALVAGPVLNYQAGAVLLTGQTGLTVIRRTTTEAGVVALAGASLPF